MSDYVSRLRINVNGGEIPLYTASGTLITRSHTRVVIGGRGPYIEFDPHDLNVDMFEVNPEETFRTTSHSVYYIDLRSKDASRTKIYLQKRLVDYADYKIKMMYVDPFVIRLPSGAFVIDKIKPNLG